jgi:hypothetical protein
MDAGVRAMHGAIAERTQSNSLTKKSNTSRYLRLCGELFPYGRTLVGTISIPIAQCVMSLRRRTVISAG